MMRYEKNLIILAILLAFCLIYLCMMPSKGIIVLKDLSRDTCILLRKENGDTIWAKREARILKNTFQDTLMLDFSLIPPKRTGEHLNLTVIDKNGKESMLYDEIIDYIKADRFCLKLRNTNHAVGELVIEYKY